MKLLGYYFFKYWVSIGLFFYYRSIKVVGLGNVPKDAPVLFLSNHQNALMDILLIATHCGRKPWYLTRADVFKSRAFRPLFQFLQMLPVYRIRDGKANLSKNKLIFEKCGQLLGCDEAILLFPEANHSLRRRVRPLSKGFTRIIDAAFQQDSDLDLQLVPIGQNYQYPKLAGDSAALYFGRPIHVGQFQNESDFVHRIKKEVFKELKQLTTHIEEERYESMLSTLEKLHADFTQPSMINECLLQNQFEKIPKKTKSNSSVARFLFRLNNLPLIFLWRMWLKPKVQEPEFEATFRFGFALLVYPIFYFLLLVILGYVYDIKTACLAVLGHAVFNLLLVKIFGITSSDQRK